MRENELVGIVIDVEYLFGPRQLFADTAVADVVTIEIAQSRAKIGSRVDRSGGGQLCGRLGREYGPQVAETVVNVIGIEKLGVRDAAREQELSGFVPEFVTEASVFVGKTGHVKFPGGIVAGTREGKGLPVTARNDTGAA